METKECLETVTPLFEMEENVFENNNIDPAPALSCSNEEKRENISKEKELEIFRKPE